MSGHKKGKLTWQGTSLLALSKMGFKVVNIENLDYKKFTAQGESYLRSIWQEKVFNIQNQYSNLKQEQRVAEKLIRDKNISLIKRRVEIEDADYYFKKGYLVLVAINSAVLAGKKEYWPHIVVLTGIDARNVAFHDPGLPPIKNKKVSKGLLRKAISPKWREDATLIAIKLA